MSHIADTPSQQQASSSAAATPATRPPQTPNISTSLSSSRAAAAATAIVQVLPVPAPPPNAAARGVAPLPPPAAVVPSTQQPQPPPNYPPQQGAPPITSPTAAVPFSPFPLAHHQSSSLSLTVGFDNVSIQRNKQTLLDGVSGVVRSGRLTGIVSCCGGRSDFYLLGALAGQEEGSGNIVANGTPVFAPSYRHTAVLLDEEFTTLDQLTVRQNLQFAASMRVASLDDRSVDDTIALLGLESCEGKPVRGCSLYAQRRVALGKELLLRPQAIFLDQPLQGLPTYEARQFLQILKRVASHDGSPAIVAITMVQSRWVLLELLDDVFLLEGTKFAFQGTVAALRSIITSSSNSSGGSSNNNNNSNHQPSSSSNNFRRSDSVGSIPIVHSTTTSDFHGNGVGGSGGGGPLPPLSAASLAEGTLHKPAPRSVSPTSRGRTVHSNVVPTASSGGGGGGNPESALYTMYRLAADPDASLADAFRRSATGVAEIRRAQIEVEHFFGLCATGQLVLTSRQAGTPSPFHRFFHLIYNSIIEVRNNIITYSAVFVVLLILSIILAAIYTSQSGQSGMQNRIGIIFFLVCSTFLHNILLVDERKREYVSFQRHRAHGYYGALTYLCYVLVTSGFVRFFTSSVFTIVVYSLGNIGSEWMYANLRDLVAIVALTSFSTSLLVYVVCAVASTVRVAHFTLFAVYTLDVILAGIILNLNAMPQAFRTVSLLSHIRLGYESAVVTQFVGQSFGCTSVGQVPAPSSPVTSTWLGNATSTTTAPAPIAPASCYTGDQYMNFLGFHNDRRWTNVYVLIGMSAGAALLWYIVAVFYKPPRRASSQPNSSVGKAR